MDVMTIREEKQGTKTYMKRVALVVHIHNGNWYLMDGGNQDV